MVYCSRATVPTSSLLLISDILATSQRNNDRDGLTGALAISDGWYLQVIEGGGSALDRLMTRLAKDPRHTDIEVLERRPVGGRLFSSWSMTSARITPEIGAGLNGLIDGCRVSPAAAVAGLLELVSSNGQLRD